ncbi:MAG: NUDIX domain-containing protein [bacterium]|nr:NUDIX domain-containing protein [bacterium]
MIEFGKKIAGKEYKDRISAYAVIRNQKNEIAFARVGQGYFLPGGGMKDGETSMQCAMREALEEIGAVISIVREIGVAGEYGLTMNKKDHWHGVGTFFEARVEKIIGPGVEPDHELAWLTFTDALPHIVRKAHSWAIGQTEPK